MTPQLNAMALNLEQKKSIKGNFAEIWIKSIVYLIISYKCSFLGFDHITLAIKVVNIRGTRWRKYVNSVKIFHNLSINLKLFQNKDISFFKKPHRSERYFALVVVHT